MELYEFWYSHDGLCNIYTLVTTGSCHSKELKATTNAVLLWKKEFSSWEEASKAENEWFKENIPALI